MRLNNAGKYCGITSKIVVLLQNVCEFWNILASSAINLSVKSRVHPRILLLWQKVCVKRHQHQFTVVLNNWTFRRHHWDKFCIKTLVAIQIGSGVEPFAKWACDRLTEDADFGKINHLFRWSSFWYLQTNKIVVVGAQKTRTHTLKSRRTQNESLFGADFSPEV